MAADDSAATSFGIAFGPVLKAMRTQRHLTQAELAKRAGLARFYISDVELGRSRPSVATLVKFAHAFCMSLPDLLNTLAGAIERHGHRRHRSR